MEPLPRHVLGAPFAAYGQDPSTAETFLSNPFWTTQYVGLGPFKLTEWQQGVQFESAAFDRCRTGT